MEDKNYDGVIDEYVERSDGLFSDRFAGLIFG